MRPWTAACVACAVALLAACHGTDLTGPPGGGGPAVVPFLRTTGEFYVAQPGTAVVDGETVSYVEFRVFFVYRNRSGQHVYLSTCRGPQLPDIERFDGATWDVVYPAPRLTCADSVTAIAPGAYYTHDFTVRAWDPTSGIEPPWVTGGGAAAFRLNWADALWRSPERGAQVPESQRVSNAFHITGPTS